MTLIWVAGLFPAYHAATGSWAIKLYLPYPDAKHFGQAVCAGAIIVSAGSLPVAAQCGTALPAAILLVLEPPRLSHSAFPLLTRATTFEPYVRPTRDARPAAQMNICLFAFNLLLPAYPLDGGRILVDALLWWGVSPQRTAVSAPAGC
jgi:Zn-dependent protease